MSIDILPTALAACGVELPSDTQLDGRNMLPSLQGDPTPLRETMFWSTGGDEGHWAVRSGRWKLVVIRDQVELFNLRRDIGETRDVAARHPEVVQDLSAQYERWLDQMAEPLSGQSKRWTGESQRRRRRAS